MKEYDVNSLPFAVPKSGASGLVTLPDAPLGMPGIDVSGIHPGTPAEVTDPSRPEETFRFRVPWLQLFPAEPCDVEVITNRLLACEFNRSHR